MNTIESLRNAISIEISPVKTDTVVDGTRNMVVCDTVDAAEWAVYVRQPDRTVEWLIDKPTQSAAVEFVRGLSASLPIYLATKSEGYHELTRIVGKPTFAVLGGTVGDNGVFKQLSNWNEADRFALVALRTTGDKSYTYVELGNYGSPDAAYYAMSGLLDLNQPVTLRYVISYAASGPDTTTGMKFPHSHISMDAPTTGVFGVFMVDSNNEHRCIYTSKSLDEIVEKLNMYNDSKKPVFVNRDGQQYPVSDSDGQVRVEDLKLDQA